MPRARVPYETIEPVAESLGDLDSRIDARIDDVEVGQQWTGFHRLEHDLWKTGDISQGRPRRRSSCRATSPSSSIRCSGSTSAPTRSATAPMSLLHGASPPAKITGEEERYSRLDLVDVAASVDGLTAGLLRAAPIVLRHESRSGRRSSTPASRRCKQDLAQYGSGASFARYDSLSKTQINALSTEIDALIAPMAALAAAALTA